MRGYARAISVGLQQAERLRVTNDGHAEFGNTIPSADVRGSKAAQFRPSGLGCTFYTFHAFSYVLSSIISDLQGHIGHPPAGIQGTADGLPHDVGMYGCHIVRSSAAQKFIHAVHTSLCLLSNELKILPRRAIHAFDDSCGEVCNRFSVAGRALGCLLRFIPCSRSSSHLTSCPRGCSPHLV
jgi:hypothetical protein